MHTPDSWVIIKIDNPEYDKPYYKVLGGWSGGYEIIKVTDINDEELGL